MDEFKNACNKQLEYFEKCTIHFNQGIQDLQ